MHSNGCPRIAGSRPTRRSTGGSSPRWSTADAFEARVAEFAAEWAARPTLAIGRTKQLFEHAFAAELDAQLALEARLQQESVGTADFTEGVNAFLEKRPPEFTGA